MRVPVGVVYAAFPPPLIMMNVIVWAHLAKDRSVRQPHLESGVISSLI